MHARTGQPGHFSLDSTAGTSLPEQDLFATAHIFNLWEETKNQTYVHYTMTLLVPDKPRKV
jgi:hypothetical protein